MRSMRIVSLLPSATEIAFALGLGDAIVGVTHECDYPPDARSKPNLTRTTLNRAGTSAEIDAATSGHLDAGSTSYQLNERLLVELEPDLILTQTLCEVCAVPHSLVQGALPAFRHRPKILSLGPASFADVLSNIKTVGDHTWRSAEARSLISMLRARVDRVSLAAAARVPTRVFCMEWLDPPWTAGHWVPDMVGLAGGIEVLGQARQPSRRVSWTEIERAQPAVIVLAICGFDLARTRQELGRTSWPAEWSRLPAVQNGQVYAVDGSAYFTRPGPRLVDGIEILYELWSGQRDAVANRFERVA
ncbi:MAG: cobalamin-binding protein [Chloroflexota bacterium]